MLKWFSLKTIDVEVYGLSKMLTKDKENPTLGIQFIDENKLEYSIESLNEIERYLDKVKGISDFEDNYDRIVLRVRAYVGEVIKKAAKCEFHWYDYDNAVKINKQIKQFGQHIGLVAVLYSKERDNLLFPLSKVCKYIENGSSDSLIFFAQVVIEQ
jgi:hypothetical protein